MHYIATIIRGYDNYSMLHKTLSAAEQWLDSENNNLECKTLIEEFDDDWQKKDSFIYTEGKE